MQCVCMHPWAHMHLSAHTCTIGSSCTCVYIHINARHGCQVSPLIPLHFFLEQCLSLTRSSLILLGWHAKDFRDPLASQLFTVAFAFYVGAGDLDSGSRAYVADNLIAKPSSQLLYF